MVHESGTGPTQTYRLTAANNGTKQFYIGLIFAPKYHAVVGPATATFTITSGTLHVSRTVGVHAGDIKQSKGPGAAATLSAGPGHTPAALRVLGRRERRFVYHRGP